MTKVTLKQELFSRYSVECEGHATGSEAVCAAVSCLVSSLESWAANSPNARIRRSEVRPGFACIEFGPEGSSLEALQACREVFSLVEGGFLRLAAGYPDYIRLERHMI